MRRLTQATPPGRGLHLSVRTTQEGRADARRFAKRWHFIRPTTRTHRGDHDSHRDGSRCVIDVRCGHAARRRYALHVRRPARPHGRLLGPEPEGQLGDGTTIDRSSPVTVAGLGDVTALAAGRYHACAVLADGTVRCWGYNGSGQLGDGSTRVVRCRSRYRAWPTGRGRAGEIITRARCCPIGPSTAGARTITARWAMARMQASRCQPLYSVFLEKRKS
jgi:hypothetical protein